MKKVDFFKSKKRKKKISFFKKRNFLSLRGKVKHVLMLHLRSTGALTTSDPSPPQEGEDKLWLAHTPLSAPHLHGRGTMTRFPLKIKLRKAKQNSKSANFTCGLKKKQQAGEKKKKPVKKTMGEMSNICQIKSFPHSSY